MSRIEGLARAVTVKKPTIPFEGLNPAALRRARVVSAATLSVAAPLLRYALTRPSGSPSFTASSLSLAAVLAGGAYAAQNLHWRDITTDSTVAQIIKPVAKGAAAVCVFAAGGAAVVMVPALRSQVDAVIRHARFGSLPQVATLALVTGAAEELFYRGALYNALPDKYQVSGSTAIYTVTTFLTGNPLLTFAASVLGYLTAQTRRETGALRAPVLVHVTWSSGMLVVLPELVHRSGKLSDRLMERLTAGAVNV